MNQIMIGFLTFFLLIACSKKDENKSSQSNNKTTLQSSSLEMRQSSNGSWSPVSYSINEEIVINENAEVMTRTVSDSDCTLTLTYNIDWTPEGMIFDGYSVHSEPYSCQISNLHCPDNYETLQTSTFIFEGFMSDDENTLTVICYPGSNRNGTAYKYTYTK